MAETRADRRAARRALESRQPVSARQPARQAQPEPERRRSNFIMESYAELRKVEWPGQSQVIQATVVVLIACIVVGVYLYANDALWKPVVQRLIGQ